MLWLAQGKHPDQPLAKSGSRRMIAVPAFAVNENVDMGNEPPQPGGELLRGQQDVLFPRAKSTFYSLINSIRTRRLAW